MYMYFLAKAITVSLWIADRKTLQYYYFILFYFEVRTLRSHGSLGCPIAMIELVSGIVRLSSERF